MGVIKKVEIASERKIPGMSEVIKNLLIGTNHNYDDIKERIFKLNLNGETINFDRKYFIGIIVLEAN